MKFRQGTTGNRAKWPLGPKGIAAILIAVVAIAALALGLSRAPSERAIGFTELVRVAQAGTAKEVKVEGERFTVLSVTGETLTTVVDDADARHDLVNRFVEAGVPL